MSSNEVETVKQKRLRELEDRIDAWIYDNGYLSEHREAILDFMSDSIDQALLSDRARLVEQVNQQMVPLLYDKTYTSDYRQGYEDAIVKFESIIKESEGSND